MIGTLSQHLARDRRLTAVGVVGFAIALALAARVAIPLPGTPVPMTLQPLAIVLAGLWLGPVGGALSMALYLAAGAAGLPVWSPFGAPGALRLLGPTGGYLWASPAAAFIAGAVAMRMPSFVGRVLAAAAGIAVLHLGGLSQLAILTGSWERAAQLGSAPFLMLDVVKSLLAAALSRARAAREQG